MLDVPGVTLPIAVALGEGDVKTVEDLADLVTDEMRGGYEIKNGERVRVPGVLESFNLAPEDAEMLILRARVAAGWIDASELPQRRSRNTRKSSPRAKYDRRGRLRRRPAEAEARRSRRRRRRRRGSPRTTRAEPADA